MNKFIMNCFLSIGLSFIRIGSVLTGMNKTAFVREKGGKNAAYGYSDGINFLPVFQMKISDSNRDVLLEIFRKDVS